MSLQDSDSIEPANSSGYEPVPLGALSGEDRNGFNRAQLGLLACLTFLAGGLCWIASIGLLTVSALKAYPLIMWGGGAAIALFVLGTTFWTSRHPYSRFRTDLIIAPSNPPSIGAYDSVTGLPTARLFHSLLKQALMKARQLNRSIAVMVIEMDDVESITEMHDQVKRNLIYRVQAARVKSAVRTTDSVARLAERTWTVLLEEIAAPEDVSSAVAKLQVSLSLPFILDGQAFFICSRIGLKLSASDHDDETAVLDSAMQAVGQARINGRRLYGAEGDIGMSRTESVPTIAA